MTNHWQLFEILKSNDYKKWCGKEEIEMVYCSLERVGGVYVPV